MNYKIGQKIKGEVTGIQPYGAFIALDQETQGLIHISEVKHGFVKDISQFLTVGQEVDVQVIDIDEYTSKISLSMRTLEPLVSSLGSKRKKYFTNRNKKIGFQTVDEALPIWIDEALNDLMEK